MSMPDASPQQQEEGVYVDAPDGSRWPVFTGSYTHDGKTWGLNIPARDREDAAARVRSIREGFEVDGRLVAVIPAGCGASVA